ncbi:SDR family NAD(P)-dependent oxidoreductase [Nocardia stercoris]|nr:SDR family NAD(P)-dependent oxidoreductase [Nocardia stercoris]
MTSYPDLNGKIALVTGGSRGIGAATARALAAEGARVGVVGRDATALKQVVTEIAASGGTAEAFVADLTDAAAVTQLRDQVSAALGEVDVLGAFAGGQGFPAPTPSLTEQRWREVLDSELTSAFLTVQAFLPSMIDRSRGSILLMSSSAGRQPGQANLAYGVANAGLVMLARHLAGEVGPHGVRVNCLAPSSILTETVEARMPDQVKQQVADMHPLRRMGTPTDVAQAALFLASEASSYLTGLTVDVAGGRITN